MDLARLQDALERLTTAIHDVETEVVAMKAEHDPLASHIFISRRHYRNAKDRVLQLSATEAKDLPPRNRTHQPLPFAQTPAKSQLAGCVET